MNNGKIEKKGRKSAMCVTALAPAKRKNQLIALARKKKVKGKDKEKNKLGLPG